MNGQQTDTGQQKPAGAPVETETTVSMPPSESASDMKWKVAKGLFWKLLENGGAQGIQFVTAIILARLLTPAEYGMLSIIMIFIILANVLVQNGFSTALIQRRNATAADFSSVFYLSLGIAALLYGVLWFAAPSIAAFYENEQLQPVIRLLSVVLFPGAVIAVQNAYVSRQMAFRGLFLATMAAVIVSGAVSIWMAMRGFGVFAMVWQQILYYFVLMLVLFITVRWRPKLLFSLRRLKQLFSFGWKLLCASLLDTLFNNLYGLFMGKIYSEALLGAYSRGEQFPKLIANNLGAAIQAVLLPAFSQRQQDRAMVRSMMRRAIRLSSFLVLPMLFGLIAVADNMVAALLTEKWLVCVPYLRLMCIAYAFWPIHITNLQAINAVGRSDVFLRLEVLKKGIGLLGLLIGMLYSPLIMVAIKAGVDFLCTFINAWPNKRLLGYRISSQWLDILPALLLSLLMCAAVYGLQFLLPGGPWLKLMLQMVAGVLIYVGLAWLLRMESFCYLLNFVRKKKTAAN